MLDDDMGSVTAENRADKRDDAARRAAVLRAKLRSVTSIRRVRLCAVMKCKPEIGVYVSGSGDARRACPHGIATCNSVWCCAACSLRIRARRMAQLTRALRGGLDARPDLSWQMISVTVRHHERMPLEWLRRGMMRAWRRTRQNGSVARIMKRRVAGTVRVVEITEGANGWHPHLHIGLLTSTWEDDERETLARVWEEACERELSTAARPDREHGIRWSKRRLRRGDGGSALEKYLTDIGLELSTVSTKTARRTSSRTPWQIAAEAGEGDAAAIKLWREYEQATKGARAIELDDRAAAFARVDAVNPNVGDVDGVLSFEGAKVVGEDFVFAVLHPEMLHHVRAYERIDARATALWLEAAAAPGPLTAAAVEQRVDACIRWMIAKTRAAPGRGATVAA